MSREHVIKRGVYILGLIGYNEFGFDIEDINNPFFIAPKCYEAVLKNKTFLEQHGKVDRSSDVWTYEFNENMKALLKLALL